MNKIRNLWLFARMTLAVFIMPQRFRKALYEHLKSTVNE